MQYEAPKGGFRTFLWMFVTQSVSVFGSTMTFFATTIWLTQVVYARPEQKPQLAVALSAVSLAFALPALAFAPIAGAWVDRHDRRRTMMLMDFASGCLSVVLAFMLFKGVAALPGLLAVMILSSIFAQFHNSAMDTSYAMLVPNTLLPRANGMMQTMFALSGVLAPPAAAAVISLPALARQGRLPAPVAGTLAGLASGAPLAIAVDAATFFLAAGALCFMSIPSPKRSDLGGVQGRPRKSIWADVKEGAQFISRRRPLLLLLLTFAAVNFAFGPTGVFYPLILKFQLAADWTAKGFTFETAMALLGMVGSLGGIAGGVLISAWGGLKQRRVFGILAPMVLSGLALGMFGLSHSLIMAAATLAVMNMTMPIMNAHSQAIWQSQTPRELQGRVFAVRRVIAQFSQPLSTALAGWAGATFSPGMVLAVLGVAVALIAARQMVNPALVHVEDREWLDKQAVVTEQA